MSDDCSLQQTVSFACPECDTPLALDAWVVIDGDHRPELLAMAAANELNSTDCWWCGAEVVADTALAIWRREAVPPLLFVPSQHGTESTEEQGIPLIERLAERASELGSRLNTRSAVVTPPAALSRALAARGRGDSVEEDAAYRFYLDQVDAWAQENETIRDIEMLETVYTWGDLARVLIERPNIASRRTITELEARREEANRHGERPLAHRIDDYLAALRACEQLGGQQALAAHRPDEPLGPRHELIRLTERLEAPDSDAAPDERVAMCKRALVLVDPVDEPVVWCELAVRLASFLADRRDGDVAAHIEEALALYRTILALLGSPDANPVAWATVRNNQAIAYRRRLRGSRSAQIENAIACYEEALDILTRTDHVVSAAETRANLAAALLFRPGPNRSEDLLRAIELLEEALPRLEVSPDSTIAPAHLALANAYFRRSQPGDDERASTSYHDAAAAYRRSGNALPAAMAQISAANADVEADSSPSSAERAIAVVEEALEIVTRDAAPREWARAHLVLARVYRTIGDGEEQVRALRACLEVCTPEVFPVDCLEASTALGNALTAQAISATGEASVMWGEAADAYGVALVAAQRLYDLPGDQRHRDNELVEREDLHHRAAFAMARAGRVMEASEALESGRARRLTEALRHEGRVLSSGRPDAAELGPDEAIVYLVVTAAGAYAVARSATGSETVALDGFTLDDLANLLIRRTASGGARGYMVGQRVPGSGMLRAALARVLPALGEAIMLPVADCLRRLGVSRAVLIPSGLLGVLPLHAASYQRGGRRVNFLDEFAVTYAPSAGALSIARDRARDADVRSPILVGLAEPLPSRPPLPYARAEVDAAARHFAEVRRLVGDMASRDGLIRALPNATHVLLACHGAFDASEPLASHLDLAGGYQLEVRELLEKRLFDGVRLVIASSCQSAVPHTATLPDEYLGLASALLGAGAASVLGTLWPVYDLTTALLINSFMRFYREGDADRGLPPQPPARALALAQRWLRDVRAGELTTHFEALIDNPGGKGDGPANSGLRGLLLSTAQTLEAASYFSFLDADHQPYADEPITWAGFVIVGSP